MRRVSVLVILFMLIADATLAAVRTSNVRPSRGNVARRTSNNVVVNRHVARPQNVVSRNVAVRATTLPVSVSMPFNSDMFKMCQAQYVQCMDNFCNVLDDNQGRCSCSANLKNYSKTENALKDATESLQNVAQQIQYIGLSSDEVETLFAQTEAELTMSKTSDNSALKNDLDRIKNMIVDVKSGTASVTDTGMSFDLSGLLDFSISSTGFDLGSLFSTNNNNTSSISNQRGEQLYKTATARCKAAVLNTCANQGVDVSVITNAYDLEIDKQCIAYERSLTDANDQMASTVRNAKSVLQKARLMVAQQKNAYDLRGCVNALDTCMQDEFVCGSDYENCLDPTGKYIVNGEIVVGSVLNNIPIKDSDTEKLLRNKIGYIDSRGRPRGMCASVMQKCQNYTMNKGAYNENNKLIQEYLNRTVRMINVYRATKINSYATSCISDVVSCVGEHNQFNTSVAVQACMPVITSCKSLTDGGVAQDVEQWLKNMMGIAVQSEPAQPGSPITKQCKEFKPGQLRPVVKPSSDKYAQMQQEDVARCTAISGGHVSAMGTMCVVDNVNDSDALTAMTQEYGWAPYVYYTDISTEVNEGSHYTGKKISANTYLYVLRWAYLDALEQCQSYGGNLDIAVGKQHNNAHIFCSFTVLASDAEKYSQICASLQNSWPMGTGDDNSGGLKESLTVNGIVKEYTCRYTPAGMYYLGIDLPGECLLGMEALPGTGNCTCKSGLFYDYNFLSCKKCEETEDW